MQLKLFFILFAFFAVAYSTSKKCRPGWKLYGSKCVRNVGRANLLKDAQNLCKVYNGKLLKALDWKSNDLVSFAHDIGSLYFEKQYFWVCFWDIFFLNEQVYILKDFF